MPQPGIFAEFINAFPTVLGRRFWPRALAVISVIIFLAVLRSIVIDISNVPTGSMVPTILPGDRILTNKLAYDLKLPFTSFPLLHWADPKRGDVVALIAPTTGLHLVKRIVGIPGDTIELRDDVLYLNGSPAEYRPAASNRVNEIGHDVLIERAPLTPAGHMIMLSPGTNALRSIAPLTLPTNKYFVMGDNRDDSFDSRYFGLIDRRNILGRVSRILFSLGPNAIPNTHRFLTTIH